MLRSMTGFGRSRGRAGDHLVSVSASSVNSRFLDISVFLPDDLAEAEAEIRNLIQERIYRGRVRIVVRTAPAAEGALSLNVSALTDYLTRIKEFVPEGVVPTVDLLSAARLAGQMGGLDEDLTNGLLGMVSEALVEMEKSRSREGEGIGGVLVELLDRLSALADEAVSLKEEENESRRRSVMENMARLPLADEDVRQRLLVEASWLIIKADVKEELERLRGHISAFREALAKGGPLGKRLEFICQEMHREVNTLSSKSSCPKLISLSVVMRELVEQAREQVRNLE